MNRRRLYGHKKPLRGLMRGRLYGFHLYIYLARDRQTERKRWWQRDRDRDRNRDRESIYPGMEGGLQVIAPLHCYVLFIHPAAQRGVAEQFCPPRVSPQAAERGSCWDVRR